MHCYFLITGVLLSVNAIQWIGSLSYHHQFEVSLVISTESASLMSDNNRHMSTAFGIIEKTDERLSYHDWENSCAWCQPQDRK